METTTFTIAGLEDVERMLAEAPRNVVASGFLKALQAGAAVISEELAIRTPERDESERDENFPPLADSQVTVIELDSQFRGGTADIGFGTEAGHVALWVEYGHVQKSHEPDKKEIGHVPAHPFMRSAADAAAVPATEAFAASLAGTLKTNPIGAKVA